MSDEQNKDSILARVTATEAAIEQIINAVNEMFTLVKGHAGLLQRMNDGLMTERQLFLASTALERLEGVISQHLAKAIEEESESETVEMAVTNEDRLAGLTLLMLKSLESLSESVAPVDGSEPSKELAFALATMDRCRLHFDSVQEAPQVAIDFVDAFTEQYEEQL